MPAEAKSMDEASQSGSLISAPTPDTADSEKAEKIKRVYGALGRILDEKRKAGWQREKDDLSRVRWPIRAVYTSWIVWLLFFAFYPKVVDSRAAQILLMVNATVVLSLYFHSLFRIHKLKRRSVQERFEEEGEKAALEIVTANKWLLEAAGGEPILKEVEVRKKADLIVAEARLKYIIEFIKRLAPGAVALAVLFGIRSLSVNNSLAGRVLALFGAVVTLVIGGVETAAQRRIIEMKECVAMLEQAQAISNDKPPPPITDAPCKLKEEG